MYYFSESKTIFSSLKTSIKCGFWISLLAILFFACSTESKGSKSNTQTVKNVESDFMDWWSYHYNEISLSSDFVSYDENYVSMSKEDFLKQLLTGGFIPFKVSTEDSLNYYQLVKLSASADERISKTIQNQASIAYRNFKMENQKFPKFKFKDVNGIIYDSDNTRSKTIFLKCWFINCKACIEEFEVLNKFQNKYSKDENIVFVSLALDDKDSLISFLESKPLNYAVIPNQYEFLNKELKVNVYPTHILIDGEGTVRKVVNRVDKLIDYFENDFLKKLSSKKKDTNPFPPPPPIPSGFVINK